MSDLRESINTSTTSNSFQSPEKEKKKIKHMREKAKTCFLKINYMYAEIEIFVRIEADQHKRTK